ncbi:hypothetical protein GCM10020219_071390 [Nonomuraea dietziae]
MIGSHAGGEACVCDLTDGLRPDRPHHLPPPQGPAHGSLIDGERRGTWVYYRIIPEAVNRLGALFAPLTEPAPRSVELELTPA